VVVASINSLYRVVLVAKRSDNVVAFGLKVGCLQSQHLSINVMMMARACCCRNMLSVQGRSAARKHRCRTYDVTSSFKTRTTLKFELQTV